LFLLTLARKNKRYETENHRIPHTDSVHAGAARHVQPNASVQALERNTIEGKALYLYADKKEGVVYIGGNEAYQHYSQLVLQQSMAEKENEDPAIQPGSTVSGYRFRQVILSRAMTKITVTLPTLRIELIRWT
jgi:hypothetical protein